MKQLNQLLPDQKELTFADWYQFVYPKHVEKVQAEKEWNKLSDKDKHLATIDPPLRLANHNQWKDKRMIPSPRRYLLRKLWTDEIIKERTKEDEQQEVDDGSIHSRFWTLLKQADSRIERAYGSTMPYTWVASLKGLTGREVARILQYLTTDTDSLMITLRKVNQVRNIGRRNWETRQKLIGNPSKPETVSQALAEMRESLK